MPSNLRRQGNMAARIDRAVQEYADGKSAHANNVTTLVGSNDKRMRVGDFRVIFIGPKISSRLSGSAHVAASMTDWRLK